MKLSDEFEDEESKNKLPVLYMTIGVIAFITLIFVIVIAVNYKGKPRKKVDFLDFLTADEKKEEKRDPLLDELGVGQSELTSDDLDFWNMYKDKEENASGDGASDGLTADEKIEKNAQELLKQEEDAAAGEDLSEGGTKTKVIRPDGSEQWVMINAYLKKNDYKDEGFVYEEPLMKYYVQGDKQSAFGVVLDESCGIVSFESLKKSGVDFVMLRAGYRGYSSGVIHLDAKFEEYAQKAQQAGIKIGVFFESQAVNAEEASVEAQFVVQLLGGKTDWLSQQADASAEGQAAQADSQSAQTDEQAGEQGTDANAENSGQNVKGQSTGEENDQNGQNGDGGADAPQNAEPQQNAAQGYVIPKASDIKAIENVAYPVVIKLGGVTNDSTRTDYLAKSQITDIANSFCQFVTESGYSSAVYGDKFWLLRRLDLVFLGDYDIWLSQDGDVPDYPYAFSMWQYKNSVKVDGIAGEVPVCISLVDYSKK